MLRRVVPWLPALGLVVGGVLALVGLVGRARVALPEPDGAPSSDVVATVDGRPIPRAAVEREVARLEAAGRRVDEATRARIVDRLVDESLLVRHGIELGLPEDDPRLRVEVARAVLDRVHADARAGAPIDDAALARHLAAHPDRFARPVVQLRGALVRGPSRAEDARALVAALRADAAPVADASRVPLPSEPLDARRLAELVGPTATESLMTAEVGAVVGPTETADGVLVAEVLASTRALPALATVREAVRLDLERTRADAALAELVRRLRARHVVRIGPP